MNMLHYKTRATGVLLAALVLAPGVSRAQTSRDQDPGARRDAILQQDQIVTEDGQIINQVGVLAPPPVPVAPAPAAPSVARSSETPAQAAYRPVNWRGRYYGRPYAYYYGPQRDYRYRDYRYRDYGPNFGPNFGPNYYQPPYGYRTYYYGTPRFGYYDYPYGGAARVGPFRVYWR
jgi:hypothetical protein